MHGRPNRIKKKVGSLTALFVRFCLFLVLAVQTQPTQDNVSLYLAHFRHLEVLSKYSATCRIFKSLFSVWKCCKKTVRRVCYILRYIVAKTCIAY